MSSDYYTLEKAAEVLGLPTAEVNRLRERNELRAFRDGAAWKFRKLDVDNLLAEKIKSRNKQQDDPTFESTADADNEDDFELSGDDGVEFLAENDTGAFDAVMESGLDLADELIEVPTAKRESVLTELSTDKSDLTIAQDTDSIAQDIDSNKTEQHESPKRNAELAVDDGESIFALAEDNEDDFSLADDSDNTADSLTASVAGAANSNAKKKVDDDDLVFATDDLSLVDDDDLTLEDDGLQLADDSELHKSESENGKEKLSLAKSTDLTDSAAGGSQNSGGQKSVLDELEDDLLTDFIMGDMESDSQIDLAGESDMVLLELEGGVADSAASANAKSESPTPAQTSTAPADDNILFEEDDGYLALSGDDADLTETSQFISGVEDDFNLTAGESDSREESESTSQLIPLDEDNTFGAMPITDQNQSPFGTSFPDSTTTTAGLQPTGIDITDSGFASTTIPGTTYQQEVQYSPLMVGGFIAVSVVLILPCVMLLDLISNVWGWNESININSPIMSLIGDIIFGKK
ncbi:MAG: helix-turn-helix domain-containing protein [Planctomycetaceae bacterium]|nr:helix-turn-helix domain-containing protein [Planctomycetaceae bacterium]